MTGPRRRTLSVSKPSAANARIRLQGAPHSHSRHCSCAEWLHDLTKGAEVVRGEFILDLLAIVPGRREGLEVATSSRWVAALWVLIEAEQAQLMGLRSSLAR